MGTIYCFRFDFLGCAATNCPSAVTSCQGCIDAIEACSTVCETEAPNPACLTCIAAGTVLCGLGCQDDARSCLETCFGQKCKQFSFAVDVIYQ